MTNKGIYVIELQSKHGNARGYLQGNRIVNTIGEATPYDTKFEAAYATVSASRHLLIPPKCHLEPREWQINSENLPAVDNG